MADDHDEKPMVQLASVELEARQFRTRGPDHLWDLIGYVNFTYDDVPTPYGVIRMTINRATLRLEFNGCEMPQADAGYKQRVPESRELAVKETANIQGASGGKAGGRFKLGITRGVDASAEAEGEISKNKKTIRDETGDFQEIHNLVTFSK